VGFSPPKQAKASKFFFEKKNQKTFDYLRPPKASMEIPRHRPTDKSFLLLFFKKADLPCFLCLALLRRPRQ
jgi:hypothetical protein